MRGALVGAALCAVVMACGSDSSTTDPDPGEVFDAAPGVPTANGCPDPLPAGWLFCDDFETGDLSAWTEFQQDPARLRVVSDPGNVRSGEHSMHTPAEAAGGFQGGEATWRSWPTGYDELYLRVWVKLASDFESLHHFLNIGVARVDDQWSADGLAGCRPNGENFATFTFDLWRDWGNIEPPGKAILYSYWPDMNCEPASQCSSYADPDAICAQCATRGAPCESGPECCWGDHLEPATAVVPPLGEWVCLEFGVKLNDPGTANGFASLSSAGTELYRESGMDIRTSTDIEANSVRVGIYNTTGDADGHSNRAWFDDVVVSTVPVGCE